MKLKAGKMKMKRILPSQILALILICQAAVSYGFPLSTYRNIIAFDYDFSIILLSLLPAFGWLLFLVGGVGLLIGRAWYFPSLVLALFVSLLIMLPFLPLVFKIIPSGGILFVIALIVVNISTTAVANYLYKKDRKGEII